MTRLGRSFGALAPALLLAVPALAHDALPVRHGIYVDATESCSKPASAYLMGYYGNALGPGHNKCNILEATRTGHAYALSLSCTNLPDEGTRKQRASITVLADDRITIQWGGRTIIPPKCGGAARTFKHFGRNEP